jgi:uncharacterized protein YecE (DUF72 family)
LHLLLRTLPDLSRRRAEIDVRAALRREESEPRECRWQEQGLIIIATAGWSIPRACATRLPGDGTHLGRYARVLRGTEIDTSFYRDHAPATYARWAKQTPRHFRFAVKLPGRITHAGGLRAARRPLQEFLAGVAGLGRRLGPLIVQLPPSLGFEARVARTFFTVFRELHAGAVACEPRHAGVVCPRQYRRRRRHAERAADAGDDVTRPA